MNYEAIFKNDLVNGIGVRTSLFVTGCSIGCSGCHNVDAQNPKSGKPFTIEVEAELMQAIADSDGLSLSGGDPLYKKNIPHILRLARTVKLQFPDKDIWLWTGYKFEVVPEEIKEVVDVIIDGVYEKEHQPSTLPFRGSDNQIMWVRDDLGRWIKEPHLNK